MKGQKGADELCAEAVKQGMSPDDILQKSLVPSMARIEDKFSQGTDTIVMVGGAPLTQNFCDEIGANFYAPDPQLTIEYLNSTVA